MPEINEEPEKKEYTRTIVTLDNCEVQKTYDNTYSIKIGESYSKGMTLDDLIKINKAIAMMIK